MMSFQVLSTVLNLARRRRRIRRKEGEVGTRRRKGGREIGEREDGKRLVHLVSRRQGRGREGLVGKTCTRDGLVGKSCTREGFVCRVAREKDLW